MEQQTHELSRAGSSDSEDDADAELLITNLSEATTESNSALLKDLLESRVAALDAEVSAQVAKDEVRSSRLHENHFPQQVPPHTATLRWPQSTTRQQPMHCTVLSRSSASPG